MNTGKNFQSAPRRTGARGLTLVELLIAMAIGLIIVAAASVLFINSSNTRREVALSADAIENGRYGLDLLSRELSQAGFYGTLVSPSGSTIAPCSTNPAVWADSLSVVAFGLNNDQADPGCLERKAGTDAIFVQRASTCTTAQAGDACAETAASAYLQVSECGSEYSAKPFVVALGKDPAFTLQTKACDGAVVDKRKLIRRFFFVDPSEVLSYVDVTPAGMTAPVPIVENIEQMQIEYALDPDGDGSPNSFTPTPADWTQAIGVRVWLLSRSANASANTKNASTFELSDTTVDVPAAGSNFKRRAYTTYIPFVTPKSRRES